MAATKAEIARWFQDGVKQGATHMIVVCDTYDWEDFHVYVMPTEDVHEKYAEHDGKNIEKIMEVYSLSQDMDAQLNEHRAFHFD